MTGRGFGALESSFVNECEGIQKPGMNRHRPKPNLRQFKALLVSMERQRDLSEAAMLVPGGEASGYAPAEELICRRKGAARACAQRMSLLQNMAWVQAA